jgi:glycosyltransferase involved in cell wall biosynthesis
LSEYSYYLAKNYAASPRISKVTVLGDKVKGRETVSSGEKIRIIRCWKLNSAFTLVNILKNIQRTRADVVHFNLIFRHFSSNRVKNFLSLTSPAVEKTLLKTPALVTLHSVAEQLRSLENFGYKNSIINRLGYRLATRLVLKADMVTVTHQHLVNILREEYDAENVTHIPHGVFGEPSLNNNPNGSKRLLFFGKVGPYKNLELTLEAFKDVVSSNKDAELVIAGSSHPFYPDFLESTLRRYKEIPNVKILGYIQENDLKNIFSSCAAVILPYKESVWSSGVLSIACMYGKAIIASDLPDFSEFAKDSQGVILFPVGNREELGKAMRSVLNNKVLAKKLGNANLEWAKRNSFGDVCEKYIDLLVRLVYKQPN